MSAATLSERWGVRISQESINLVNVTLEEALHIQQYPMLNGPNRSLTQNLWHKLTDPNNWRTIVRGPQDLDIEVHKLKAVEAFLATRFDPSGPSVSSLAFDVWSLVLLPEDAQRVLIAGSMEGAEPILLCTLWPHREYFTLDILLTNAATLQRKGFRVCVGDIHRLPYGSESFDAVYNNNVMEHLYNDVDECMREIFEILRPGGVFCFVIPTETSSSNPDAEWQRSNVGRSYNWWLVDPGHPWKTDLHDIQARLLSAGFEQPTFAYIEEQLEKCAGKSRDLRRRRPLFWRKRISEAFEGSLMLQTIESRARQLTGCHRYLGFRRRFREVLGLPNRQEEVLQVAVVATKPKGRAKSIHQIRERPR